MEKGPKIKKVSQTFIIFLLIFLQEKGDLKDMMMKVFREGLEGLVLKDVNVIQYYFALNVVIRYYSGSVLWQSYDIRFIQVTNVKLDDQGLNVATFLSCILTKYHGTKNKKVVSDSVSNALTALT